MARKFNPFSKLPNFPVPLFNSGQVFLIHSREQWAQCYEWLGLQTPNVHHLNGVCATVENTNPYQLVYMIGIFNESCVTLVHESAHCAFNICRDVGVEIDLHTSNETYCYMIDHIFEQFYPLLGESSETS